MQDLGKMIREMAGFTAEQWLGLGRMFVILIGIGITLSIVEYVKNRRRI